jgi:hypothetical protein
MRAPDNAGAIDTRVFVATYPFVAPTLESFDRATVEALLDHLASSRGFLVGARAHSLALRTAPRMIRAHRPRRSWRPHSEGRIARVLLRQRPTRKAAARGRVPASATRVCRVQLIRIWMAREHSCVKAPRRADACRTCGQARRAGQFPSRGCSRGLRQRGDAGARSTKVAETRRVESFGSATENCTPSKRS